MLRHRGDGDLPPAVVGFDLQRIARRQAQRFRHFIRDDSAARLEGKRLFCLYIAQLDPLAHRFALLRHGNIGVYLCAVAVLAARLCAFDIHHGRILYARLRLNACPAAVYLRLGQIVFHRNDVLILVQIVKLKRGDGGNAVPDAKADKQQRRAARNAQHRHAQPFFVAKQVARRYLAGKAHAFPKEMHAL